jgi:hypothetical protein
MNTKPYLAGALPAGRLRDGRTGRRFPVRRRHRPRPHRREPRLARDDAACARAGTGRAGHAGGAARHGGRREGRRAGNIPACRRATGRSASPRPTWPRPAGCRIRCWTSSASPAPATSPSTRTFTVNLARLLTTPLASRLEAQRFEQVKLEVAREIEQHARDTRIAWVEAVAANQALEYARQVDAAAEASAELAERMARAGNMSQLDLAREQVFHAEPRPRWRAPASRPWRARKTHPPARPVGQGRAIQPARPPARAARRPGAAAGHRTHRDRTAPRRAGGKARCAGHRRQSRADEDDPLRQRAGSRLREPERDQTAMYRPRAAMSSRSSCRCSTGAARGWRGPKASTCRP